MTAATLPVAWAGLGALGAPMAQRVLQAGLPLRVWNRDPRKAAALADHGAARVSTPAQLAVGAAVVCVCVTDALAVEQVVFGDDGIASGLAPGTVVVDHSTIPPEATRRLAERLEALGGQWVDAPVSGGPGGARAGRLTVFAGGHAQALQQVQPVLQAYAARVTHLGAVGSGQTAKACNQMVSFGTAAVLAEALHLAHCQGLDAALLLQAMQDGFADSAVLRHFGPAMLAGRYDGSTLNALKDMEIALALGRQADVALPMTRQVAEAYRQLAGQGHTQMGLAGLMRLRVEGPLADAPRTRSSASTAHSRSAGEERP